MRDQKVGYFRGTCKTRGLLYKIIVNKLKEIEDAEFIKVSNETVQS